jgi:hypothetical protein
MMQKFATFLTAFAQRISIAANQNRKYDDPALQEAYNNGLRDAEHIMIQSYTEADFKGKNNVSVRP